MLELGADVSKAGWMKIDERMRFGTPLDLIRKLRSSK